MSPIFNDDYINEATTLLTFGEQAPFSSPSEIENLPIRDFQWWIKKVSDIYQKQKEEMDKAKRRK
jgi:hypothetical protein